MKGWNSQVPLTATQGRQSPDVDNIAINHYHSFLIRMFDICLLLFAINVLLSIFAYNAIEPIEHLGEISSIYLAYPPPEGPEGCSKAYGSALGGPDS